MAVCLFDTKNGDKGSLCCYTDSAGAHWCLKEIRNVKRDGFSKVYVCSGQRCNFKLFYSSPTVFRVDGIHHCAFDHENEYRRRVRNKLALDTIRDNVTLRPRDVVNIVMHKTAMTEREKKTLHQFISHHLSMKEMKPPQTMNDLVLPEELKNVTNENGDIGDHMFLIYTGILDPGMRKNKETRWKSF